MVKSTHVGFRLHPIKDKDIIEDLQRYKNATERWKEVYRLALAQRGAPFIHPSTAVPTVAAPPSYEPPKMVQPKPEQVAAPPLTTMKPEEPLNWNNFPPTPTVAPSEDSSKKARIKANILNNNF